MPVVRKRETARERERERFISANQFKSVKQSTYWTDGQLTISTQRYNHPRSHHQLLKYPVYIRLKCDVCSRCDDHYRNHRWLPAASILNHPSAFGILGVDAILSLSLFLSWYKSLALYYSARWNLNKKGEQPERRGCRGKRETEDTKPGKGFLYGEVILVAKGHLSPREMQISQQDSSRDNTSSLCRRRVSPLV